jgi:hypothetical protein
MLNKACGMNIAYINHKKKPTSLPDEDGKPRLKRKMARLPLEGQAFS